MKIYTLIKDETVISSTSLSTIAPEINKTANSIRILFSRYNTDVLKGSNWVLGRSTLQRIKGRGKGTF